MKKLWLIIIVAILLLYFPVKKGIRRFQSYQELNNKKETFSGSSDSLQKTAVLPTFDSPLVVGKNNIWCSSFQLAWNEMKDTVIQEPINVVGAEELAERLNTAKQMKSDIDQNSYYVNAGKVSDGIVNLIQNDMMNRFPSVKTPEFSPSNELIAYSYMETYTKFTTPFRENDRALIFTDSGGRTTSLKSFGVWQGFLREYKPLCEQIEVLYCKLDEDYNVREFALDLCKDSKPYQVVVSCIEPQSTLEKTFSNVQKNINAFKNDPQYDYLKVFEEVDVLQVPDMFWKITHHFTELEEKPLGNQNFQGMPMSTAMQMISFRLDRSGVLLKSEAKVAVDAFPRLFVLDKPFLLYLKKRDAEQPFFVMWVDNAELLTPFDSE